MPDETRKQNGESLFLFSPNTSVSFELLPSTDIPPSEHRP